MSGTEKMHPAKWWRAEEDGRILCTLCPRYCRMNDGQAGFCFIRQNQKGKLVSLGYGRPTSFAVDPIEKKPLHHFLPGTSILSFGTAGCNLGCKFCQNWNISKARINELNAHTATVEDVVSLAVREECRSIAFTYNEPVIFGEFVIDVSERAREAGLKNVMVTAGYVTPEARDELFRHIDAANVDLKAFTEDFYRKMTLGHIEPVKETLVWLRRETEVWIEITTLLIPDLNDSAEEISAECRWIVDRLGRDVPLHFTAFHPAFRVNDRPRTPTETLRRARDIALKAGVRYVYLGNVHDPESQCTSCPVCGALLIERDWHSVKSNRLRGGACADCGNRLPGLFGEK